jgi:hypothetical protein
VLLLVRAWAEGKSDGMIVLDDVIEVCDEVARLRTALSARDAELARVRAEALEEAARVCERVRDGMIGDDFSEFECVEDECAHEIRALTPPAGSET